LLPFGYRGWRRERDGRVVRGKERSDENRGRGEAGVYLFLFFFFCSAEEIKAGK
jgi:hypothetical protein